MATAVAFLVAGLLALGLPPTSSLATWLPLHLTLAGGAGTAIAAMLPFFVSALSVAPPAPLPLRIAGVALVAIGVTAAAVGRALAPAGEWLAVAGAVAYVAGILAVLAAAALPLPQATGTRRPLTELAYAVALMDVAIGVSLASLFLAGGETVVAQWPALKPAHAWLNLFGFVTLAIAGTLLHFAPTVAGSRIRARPVGAAAVAALVPAAPIVAIGFAAGSGAVAAAGAGLELVGAAALAVHGWQAHRDRAGWTTELEWHRVTGTALLIAPAWLVVAAAIAAVEIVKGGADAGGWNLVPLVGPLVAGFVVQVLLGALAFLVPATTTTSPSRHAAMRHSLGRYGSLRLAAWNAGVAALSVGLGFELGVLTAAGTAILVADLAATLALLGLGLFEGR